MAAEAFAPSVAADRKGQPVSRIRAAWTVRIRKLEVTPREAIVVGVAFGLLVFGWSGITFLVELALGYSARAPSAPSQSFALLDGIWHVATAFAVALPARRRLYLWYAPAVGLGADLDHLFGATLPTVVLRPAHDLIFLGILGVALFALFGRFAALSAPGLFLLHIGVDGGLFPFFAPATLTTDSLTFPEQVALISAGASLVFIATRRARDLRSPRAWLSIVGAVAVLAAVLALLPAGFSGFTSN
ncbi:MAG TPA: hypothetical protein VFF67_02310 [Thermoplasmata archaeon]|nr:hypothetical protein [Thermoplasmata archaeon]